jgi:hypothetical protein
MRRDLPGEPLAEISVGRGLGYAELTVGPHAPELLAVGLDRRRKRVLFTGDIQRVATISESNGPASVILGAVSARLIALGFESADSASPIRRIIFWALVITLGYCRRRSGRCSHPRMGHVVSVGPVVPRVPAASRARRRGLAVAPAGDR